MNEDPIAGDKEMAQAAVPATVNRSTEGDTLRRLNEIENTGAIVLYPTPYMREISPFHKSRIESVVIETIKPGHKDSPDLYKEKNGEVALKKGALRRIARAAGIEWDTTKDGCRWESMGPDTYAHTAVLKMRGPDGLWVRFIATKEIVLEVEKSEIEMRADGMDWGGGEDAAAAKKAAYIRKEYLALRKHVAANCETKAHSRAIREALAMQATYPNMAFAKPIAVPRIDFQPDYSDPRVRATMAGITAESSASCFPGASDDEVYDAEVDDIER